VLIKERALRRGTLIGSESQNDVYSQIEKEHV